MTVSCKGNNIEIELVLGQSCPFPQSALYGYCWGKIGGWLSHLEFLVERQDLNQIIERINIFVGEVTVIRTHMVTISCGSWIFGNNSQTQLHNQKSKDGSVTFIIHFQTLISKLFPRGWFYGKHLVLGEKLLPIFLFPSGWVLCRESSLTDYLFSNHSMLWQCWTRGTYNRSSKFWPSRHPHDLGT